MGVKNCCGIAKIFSEWENVKFYDFWLQGNYFLIKYKKNFFDLDIIKVEEQNLKRIFIDYIKDFENLMNFFKKLNIEHLYVSTCAFKNETNASVVNKLKILKKMMSVKNEFKFNTNYDLEFDFLKLDFYPIKNFTLCLEYQTVGEVKSKYDCEIKNYIIKLSDHKELRIKFNNVIKSMYNLEKMASIVDDIKYKRINDLNCNSSNDHISVINLYKNEVEIFKEKLFIFFNECDNIFYEEYNFSRNLSTDILTNILELDLETEINFKEKVDNTFKVILNDDSFGKNRFERIYSNDKFEGAENFMKFYHITRDFLESCSILNLNYYIDIYEANFELFKYLNYKKQFIYDLIKLINLCFKNSNPCKFIYNAIYNFKFLDILFDQFISKSYIHCLHKAFEKNFQNSIYTSSSFENCGIVNSISILKYEFSLKIKLLIRDMEKSKTMCLLQPSTAEVVCMSIVFDILKIVSENIIEERDCYLSEWKNDNEIPVSFKKIFNLCEKFIES